MEKSTVCPKATVGQLPVLIVDDEEAILFAVQDYLELHDFRVDCAESREEADVLLENNPYSVLIADLRLTPLHHTAGLAVVSRARQLYPAICIVVLTGYGSQENRIEAIRCGANVFLDKPVNLAELTSVVFEVLEARGWRTHEEAQ